MPYFPSKLSLNSLKALFISVVLLLGFSELTLADNQNMDELYELVENHVKQNLDQKLKDVQINVRELPGTFKLASCGQPLEFEHNLNQNLQGRQTILVNCPNPSWRVFITVDISAKTLAVLSTKGIPRKAVINHEDVELKLVPLNEVRRGSLENLESVVGMRAKRLIAPNAIITIQMLDAPYWVLKGQEVVIVTDVKGITISTKGTALESGMQQDQVSIRNNNSQIIVKGIVIAPNTVEIP